MSSLSKNLASVMNADAVYVGGNWGFMLKTNPDYQRTLQILTSDKDVSVIETENGMIAFVDMNYLYNAINQINPITPEIQEIARNRVSYNSQELGKLMQAVLAGNCKYLRKERGYNEIQIALYSYNTSNRIRANGVEYPAFSLTVMEACKEIIKYSKGIKVYLNIGDGFDEIHNFKTQSDVNRIIQNLEIANSLTGAFLTVRFQ